MGKMGERLMIHPTSVTSIINRLEDDGFVVRLAHPSDRRTRLAQITDAGRELAARASVVVDKTLFGLGSISEDTQDHLIELIRELRIAVGDITATGEEGQGTPKAG